MQQASVTAVAFESCVIPVARTRDAVARAVPHGTRLTHASAGTVGVLAPVAPAAVRQWAEGVRRDVADAIGDADCTAAVGGAADGALGPQRALLQAEQAVRMAHPLGLRGRTIVFEDLGPYCFVLGQPQREIRQFSARALGPLADDPELLATLDAYLRAQGSLNDVARELHIHRNTVRLRLRRIVALTGSRLDSANDRLALQLAILARHALEGLAPCRGRAG